MATSKKDSAEKSATKKASGDKDPAAKRTPNAAFMKPMQPSPELAAVIGNEPMPRTEVTKRVWDYIRQHNLQNPQNKRMIMADEKLKRVFGGKDEVSMFEMTKLINQHLK